MTEYGLTLHTTASRTLYHYLGDPKYRRRLADHRFRHPEKTRKLHAVTGHVTCYVRERHVKKML
jgi:hypothetical protein